MQVADKIKDIGDEILRQVDIEKITLSDNESVGRAELIVNDKEMQIWITRKPYQKRRIDYTDIQNNYVGGQVQDNSNVFANSNTFWRNSELVRFIIQKKIGKHSTPKVNIQIDTFAHYIRGAYDGNIDATNGAIYVLEEPIFKFSSLIQSLREVKEAEKELKQIQEELRKAEEREIEDLVNKYNETEKRLLQRKERLKRHIRKEIELRDNPILDSEQERIKRSKIYNNELIINGGPGTGKTTTLVQRISYLTQNFKDIEKDVEDFQKNFGLTDTVIPKLFQEDYEIINDKRKSWIFFSPSNLLKAYLKNAMASEELSPDDSNVTTWENHRDILMRTTGLFDGSKKSAFKPKKIKRSKQKKNNSDEIISFYKLDIDNFLKLDRTFKNFYWSEIRKTIQKAKDFDVSLVSWKYIGSSIQKELEKTPKGRDLRVWISLFVSLERKFKDETKSTLSELKEILDKAAAKVVFHFSKNNVEAYHNMVEMLKNDRKNQLEDEEDEDEDAEINEEIFEDSDITLREDKLLVQRKTRTLIRKIGLKRFETKTKFSRKDRTYLEFIQSYIDDNITDEILNYIGERVLYGKYFAKLTKGVISNIINPAKTNYKKFRKQKDLIEPLLTDYGIKELPILLADKTARNLRLHNEEQDYFLYFLFTLIRTIRKSNKNIFQKNINNPYFGTFDIYMRAMVAVDEATDFSIFELAVMRQLTYPKFNSITLSGDIMQRMKSKGIKSWSDFTKVFPSATVKDLTISYRQTPVLLEVATTIYKAATETSPNFSAYTEPSLDDAPPLLYINDNEEEQIDWLAQRILEINNIYGNIFPSIAIFVKDDTVGKDLEEELSEVQELFDAGIKFEACPKGKILSNDNKVRIFDIQYIKGLEFEAVFFMDIDQLSVSHDDLIDKYIYVGVSRATFFLGVTAQKGIPERFKSIETHFEVDGRWINE